MPVDGSFHLLLLKKRPIVRIYETEIVLKTACTCGGGVILSTNVAK